MVSVHDIQSGLSELHLFKGTGRDAGDAGAFIYLHLLISYFLQMGVPQKSTPPVAAMLLLGCTSLAPLILSAQSRDHAAAGSEGSVVLKNVVPPRLHHAYDRGPIESDKKLSHLAVIFRRTPDQQRALDQLLEQQQDPFSVNFHRWLTPEEFGDRFGADTSKLNRVADWLRSRGFTVDRLPRSRGWVVFGGTAAQVRESLHTEIHYYELGGKIHFAPASPPAIPAEFESFVGVIRGLDDFYLEPPRRFAPMANLSDGTHALVPLDLELIYGMAIGTTMSYGLSTGSGQKIAVVGQSAIDVADIRQFRGMFQMLPSDPQVILVGDDPGVDQSGLFEADADLEWAGAAAREAALIYIYAKDVFAAAQEAIDQNLAPILSFSYGGCEPAVSTGDAETIRDLAQQANAQGITWIAASGDTGAAGCDRDSFPASQGLAVMVPASVPEITGVGGTEFNEADGRYWNATNAPDQSSAVGYIPEVGWNDSSSSNGLRASGGGVSTLYPRPAWQQAPGAILNNGRNVPDVALDASVDHDPYIVVSGGKPYAAGGTSISTPVFAGVLALVEERIAGDQGGTAPLGNINPSLYSLAANAAIPPIFHDVTDGDNMVPCAAGTQDCVNGTLGYIAGPGYDQVTGLGSVSVPSLLNGFSRSSVTTLATPAAQATEGAPLTVTVTVSTFNRKTPVGSVEIDDQAGSVASGNALDSSGTSTISLTLSPGTHLITAKYIPGDPYYWGSASSVVTIVVIPLPPKAPVLVFPVDKAAGISVSAAPSWNAIGNASSYDVYFGSTNPPPFWANVRDVQCTPTGLAPGTTYYWKIVARNISGSASSAVWSFTTSSQPFYTILTFAGTGQYGFSGDGGPAAQALISPADMTFDTAGNLYFVDAGNYRIRKITPDGIISTVAGSGDSMASGDGGPAIAAGLGDAGGIAIDREGNLYLSTSFTIRKISPDGIISTIAGQNGNPGYLGDGGPAIDALVSPSGGLALDSSGSLYIAGANCVRKITAGIITTFAGHCGWYYPGYPQGDGGPATGAYLAGAGSIAIDSSDNVYIAETTAIRRVSKGIIFGVSGYGTGGDGPALTAQIYPGGLSLDSAGNLFFTDGNQRIRRISNGVLTTVAGGGTFYPGDGGPGTSADLLGIGAIRLGSSGTIYVGQTPGRIRALSHSDAPPATTVTNDVLSNATALARGPVVAGSIATLFGNFALDLPTRASEKPLPTALSGLSVQFDSAGGISAPLFYVSSGQVNLQIPWELAGQSSVLVGTMLNGDRGPVQNQELVPFAPAILTTNGQATGLGVITDSSGRQIDYDNPAQAGDVVQIYCTGLGAVTNTPPTGRPASDTTPSPTLATPSVTVGSYNADVLFSGLAPGTVGEYVVSVRVPDGVTGQSSVSVTISIGGIRSAVTMVAR